MSNSCCGVTVRFMQAFAEMRVVSERWLGLVLGLVLVLASVPALASV